MFLIPTYLAPSPINGLGVFTATDIPAGMTLWEYTPGLDVAIPFDQIPALPEVIKAFLKRYAYVPKTIPGIYILCADNGRFVNHAENPNMVQDDIGREFDRAARPIAAGEELTCHYFKDFAPDVMFGLGPGEL